jgi:hypothetical protein
VGIGAIKPMTCAQERRAFVKSTHHLSNRPHNRPRPVVGEDVRPATLTCDRGGRAGSARRWSSVTPRASRSGSLKHRDEGLAARDRRTHQARAEIARAVRRVSQPSARRGPPSERVKNPRSEGSRPPAARSARDVSKRYSPNLYTGHGPDAPPPPQACRLSPTGTCTCACPLQTHCEIRGHAQGHVPVWRQITPARSRSWTCRMPTGRWSSTTNSTVMRRSFINFNASAARAPGVMVSGARVMTSPATWSISPSM